MQGSKLALKLPFRMLRWQDELKASQFPDHLSIQVAHTSVEEQKRRLRKILDELGWVQTGEGSSRGYASEDGGATLVDAWITGERDFEVAEGLGERGRQALVVTAYSGMIALAVGLVSLFLFASRLSTPWAYVFGALMVIGAMTGMLAGRISYNGTFESTLVMIRLEGTFPIGSGKSNVGLMKGDFIIRVGLGRVQSYNWVSKGSSGRHAHGLVEGKRFQTELDMLREKLQSSSGGSDGRLPSKSALEET